MKHLFLLTINFAAVFGEKTSVKDLSNGFRNEIDWIDWNVAIGVAKDLHKPIFLLIHKTWCGACRGLKKEFSASPKMPELFELSKKFVMVNVEDDDEPEDEKYAPDGGYIPRILFLDTSGEPLQTNNEARYKNNKYFYPLIPQVIDAMERALIEFEAKEQNNEKTEKSEEKYEEITSENAVGKSEERRSSDHEKKEKDTDPEKKAKNDKRQKVEKEEL
ncbi:hypothetical protein DICVIV_10950 [Dictyocaulus viviparus]|uniref:Thioredoxin domain-containing protein n=1 Tax=Dictyocaulus viviparus TaxID=29172 RepID=A0A0D8XEM0_DICVI|nr:hypothetical protein DICVIV_10950 [Dictyocaulus viviparus]